MVILHLSLVNFQNTDSSDYANESDNGFTQLITSSRMEL